MTSRASLTGELHLGHAIWPSSTTSVHLKHNHDSSLRSTASDGSEPSQEITDLNEPVPVLEPPRISGRVRVQKVGEPLQSKGVTTTPLSSMATSTPIFATTPGSAEIPMCTNPWLSYNPMVLGCTMFMGTSRSLSMTIGQVNSQPEIFKIPTGATAVEMLPARPEQMVTVGLFKFPQHWW